MRKLIIDRAAVSETKKRLRYNRLQVTYDANANTVLLFAMHTIFKATISRGNHDFSADARSSNMYGQLWLMPKWTPLYRTLTSIIPLQYHWSEKLNSLSISFFYILILYFLWHSFFAVLCIHHLYREKLNRSLNWSMIYLSVLIDISKSYNKKITISLYYFSEEMKILNYQTKCAYILYVSFLMLPITHDIISIVNTHS